MHDILEGIIFNNVHVNIIMMTIIYTGVLQLTMGMLLREFIVIQKIINLQLLNSRIVSFCYGPVDATNKPTPLKDIPTETGHGVKQSGQIVV